MNIYQNIVASTKKREKLLAVLIDPEKMAINKIPAFFEKVHQSMATHIFVGGSTDAKNLIENVVIAIKKATFLPVILFPGSYEQVTNKADGILFLSLLSGRNPDYLIGHQVQSAATLQKSQLEIMATGYLLIDGGTKTAVQRVSNTLPIPQNNINLIINTALAGEFLGKKLIYLEAGSGAKNPVNTEVIKAVKNEITIPLIVGGGITNKKHVDNAYKAGADMIVIGTAFENDHAFFNELKKE